MVPMRLSENWVPHYIHCLIIILARYLMATARGLDPLFSGTPIFENKSLRMATKQLWALGLISIIQKTA